MRVLSDTAMWLESHGNLARHPKTRRLMQRMGWTLPHTIGNLHLLWWWALEYAPTGDLTHFEPEQITYDLDLGGSTPEQFIETMVEAGFLDKSEDGVLRIHDWPEYTAKSLRPKFRKTPDRWHQVLRSYGLPVTTRRTPHRDTSATPNDQMVSSRALRDDQLVGNALRAVRRESPSATAESENETATAAKLNPAAPNVPQESSAQHSEPDAPLDTHARHTSSRHDGNVGVAPIPKCLSARRNFNDWWAKLQEQYENKGCPLTAHEQTELLAMLARNPFAAVEKLQYSVVNFEKSYATLLAPQKRELENTS